MGRLFDSPRPARLLVLLSGGFTLAYLLGLIVNSGLSDAGPMSQKALLILFAACLSWTFIALLATDRRADGPHWLTRGLEADSRAAEIVILILALGYLVIIFTMIPWNDERANLDAARYLFANGFRAYFANYSEINGWLGPHHPPLLPLIYAGLYRLFGAHLIVGRIFAVACSCAAAFLGYWWIARSPGSKTALTGLILLGAFPLVLFNGASSILDAPFWLVFTAALLLFERFLKTVKIRDALLCALATGAACLSRYNGLLLLPIFLFSLLAGSKTRLMFRRPAIGIILLGPILIAAPWLFSAALTGSLMTQFHRIASFVLVAVIPPGGAFYIKQILAPLAPFMIGLWNFPLYAIGGWQMMRKTDDDAQRRVFLTGVIYILAMLLTLPNPRYLLAIAPALAAPVAKVILSAEDREGRGAELIAYLLGLSAIHIIVVLQQSAIGAVYLFY